MTQQEALFKYILRLGDNALIHSHRLSEWCSNAPFLEEDLALTNLALDMIGRAQALLQYAGSVEGKGRTEDTLAYRRSERQYYNNLLVELPNTDFAYTIARLLFVSAFEKEYYTALQNSADSTLAAIAAKTLKEIKYHFAHAHDWVVRLGMGTEESKQRVQNAVNDWWMYTSELFEMDETDEQLVKEGIVPDLKALYPAWLQAVTDTLKAASLDVPVSGYMQTGSRKGIHTEHLGHLLSEMQYLQRAYPDAEW
ncbi:MAG: 1,2-phenylacetyl-CoA epoxidase subunit PaaC [Flavipsychrobacter sp.]